MHFINYAERIYSVKDVKTFGQLSQEKQEQNIFAVKNSNMYLEKIEKSKFVQINEKRYYFSDGIVSLPFPHPFLSQLVKHKEIKKERIKNYILKDKQKLLAMKKDALLKRDRLTFYPKTLLQNPMFYHLNWLKRSFENNQNMNFLQTTRSYVLNSF